MSTVSRLVTAAKVRLCWIDTESFTAVYLTLGDIDRFSVALLTLFTVQVTEEKEAVTLVAVRVFHG